MASSSQVHVNPDDLQNFLQQLDIFNRELRDNAVRITRAFRTVSETWDDREQRRFAEEFERVVAGIAQFLVVSEEHVPYLRRKVEDIRAYLQH